MQQQKNLVITNRGGIIQVRVCMCMYECGAHGCVHAWYERKCVAEPDSQIGGVIAGVDCYMAWLTASQIGHTTFAGHRAYNRNEGRHTWFKGVS